jgi:glycerophosphoryl diester phosphodiesterase
MSLPPASLARAPATHIASHRGGAFLWPENSPTAFRETAKLPVEQVEFDVHLSADGEVVVIHDPTLDRTTDASGPVAARTLAELRNVRLKGARGEAVPTLAEVAAVFRGTSILLRAEIKVDAAGRSYAGIVGKVRAVLETNGMLGQSMITSFQAPAVAEAARTRAFGNRLIWLLDPRGWRDLGAEGAVAVARAHRIPGLSLHEAACDAAAVAAVRGAGLGIGTWAANHAETIRRTLALGVDAFTTDDPPLALRLRGEGA